MPNRQAFARFSWFLPSLALLALLAVAPSRPSSDTSPGPTPPHGLRRDASPLPGQPTLLLTAALPTDDLPQVTALPYETEEQDRADAFQEPRFPFFTPCSFSKVATHRLIALRTTLARYPLRC